MSLGNTLAKLEYQHLAALLEAHGGNVAAAALEAGMSRESFKARLAQHGIAPSRPPAPRVRRPMRCARGRFRRVGKRAWVREP